MKKNSYVIFVFIALLSFSCRDMVLGPDPVKGPKPAAHSSRLATLLDSLRYELDLPALAAAVITDTGIIDARAVGCRRYGGPADVTDNDVFFPGSCGKSFTSVLLGTLIDEGKLKWTTTLKEIFPEYMGVMRGEYQNVNILELLSHSAGFMRDSDFKLRSDSPRELRLEVVEWALAQPPAVSKGTPLYSNVGFTIAGAVAEKIADEDYETLVAERVFKPLGLSTAGFWHGNVNKLENQPLQHTPGHSPIMLSTEDKIRIIQNPAGEGLYLSIGDWAKFGQWVLACETGNYTLLKPETARTITTPVNFAIGVGALGWGTVYYDQPVGKVLMHLGSNGYNYAQIILVTGQKYGIVAATNQGAGYKSNPVDPVINLLSKLYLAGKL